MKTMKHRMIVMLMAAVFALPAMAQMNTGSTFLQTEAPAAAFRSTSTLPTCGSTYSSAPMFNADGTATNAAASSYESEGAPSKPRKVGPPTPGGDPTPLGDATLPLLLLAVGYILLRKRNSVKRLNC